MIKRYLSEFNLDKIRKRFCDVVIVGTGIAGLYTALNLSHKYRVLVITKDRIKENNSSLAQGGIAACINDEEDMKLHIEDTLRAGEYYNNEEAVKILVSEAPENIGKLVEMGTRFDRDSEGNLMATREGGHSDRRVLHSKDQTGKEIIRALTEEVKRSNNIEVIEGVFAIDILTFKDKSIGILVKDKCEKYAIIANDTVLASGGVGQIYMNTTNSTIATGDGIAMAYRAGAEIIDMEFIQFHPTALYSENDRKRFLISEAVRGEGAVLRNSKGEAFMERYHELKDLAPRHIVAKAILGEMKKENSKNVYLDITNKSEGYIKNRFPFIYQECLNRGIDITKKYIPVCPVQHYIMGGIKTDYKGRTSIENLYACGETASLGVHGANRLASNSLLDGIVFGSRVAKDINENIVSKNNYYLKATYENNKKKLKCNLKETKEILKKTMNKYAFIFRREAELDKAYGIIREILENLYKASEDSIGYYECINIATVAYLIVESALKRKETLGSHIMFDDLEAKQLV
ncbi:L-aspartate oxidase [Wukongibacter baidiensis]|uniref:L-aspartate oxidase n=1 Tax=Wukongibacter baidiensis TaxID=1723361 RepID=UPI003D7F192C